MLEGRAGRVEEYLETVCLGGSRWACWDGYILGPAAVDAGLLRKLDGAVWGVSSDQSLAWGTRREAGPWT